MIKIFLLFLDRFFTPDLMMTLPIPIFLILCFLALIGFVATYREAKKDKSRYWGPDDK